MNFAHQDHVTCHFYNIDLSCEILMNPVMIRNFKVPNLKFSGRPRDEIVFHRPTHPPPLDQPSATVTHFPHVNNNLSHNLIVVFDLSLSLVRPTG